MRPISSGVAPVCLLVVLAACGADSPRSGAEDAADGDGKGNNPTGSAAALDLPFEGATVLSELTTPQAEEVCEAVGRYYASLPQAHQDYRCLAHSVDAGQVGNDPAFTCQRFRDLCFFELPDVGIDLDIDNDPVFEKSGCSWEMMNRRREVCSNPTLDEFAQCVLNNIALENEGNTIDQASLSCEEATPLGSIRPQGLRDCACGRPLRIGDPPADDLDWDYVLDEQDECPTTELDFKVAENGCSFWDDRDQDGVWDEVDVCGGTEPNPTAMHPNGCSQSQDGDLDGYPDLVDICPDTAPGAEVMSTGCSLAQDEDGDGTPNAGDWCPLTPADAPIVAYGCGEGQGEPWSAGILDTPPDGLTIVTLGATPEEEVHLHLVPALLQDTDEGLRYTGAIYFEVPDYGLVTLPDADVTFLGTADAPTGVSGEVPVPFPSVALFEGAKVGGDGKCTIGFGFPSYPELASLGAPLDPTRQYLFADCHSSVGITLGPISLSRSQDFVLVLDPADPGFFARADMDGLRPFGKLEDTAVGFSNNGLLQWEPHATWGVEENIKPFSGHLFASGSLPISTPMPSQIASLHVSGEAIANLDPQGDGISLAEAIDDLRFGVNGDVKISLNVFTSFPITMTIGEASLVADLSGGKPMVAVSGGVGPGDLTLPPLMPISQPMPVKVAARVTDNPDEFLVRLEGQFRLLGSMLDLPFVPDPSDADFKGTVELKSDSVHVTGTLSGELHPWVPLEGDVHIDAFIRWDLTEFYVTLKGNLLFDTPLKDFSVGEIYFGSDDIRIDGESFP